MRLVLASRSPRRRELLAAAGWTFDVATADVDESRQPGESPRDYVERVARAKALAAPTFAEATAGKPDPPVIVAADTVVVVDADILGKPIDVEDAKRMLRRLSGRAHDVVTGVAVRCGERIASTVEETRVWFDPLTDAMIDEYVRSGEPFDKAGAYGIQGRASRFIPRIDGSYTAVVGLPVAAVARLVHEVAPSEARAVS
jgi:septum formation protein